MKVLKFGGTSLGSPEAIERVISIIIKEKHSYPIVVSAFGGVTDLLIDTATRAAKGDESYKELLLNIEDRHISVIQELINAKHQSSILAHTKVTLNELDEAMRGIFLIKECSPRTLDLITSFGERLSAYIVSEVLKSKDVKAQMLDARKCLKTDDRYGGAMVSLDKSFENIRQYFEGNNAQQIITGFIASTDGDVTTTLGRGGSDYSAALFAAALDAKAIEIWTDVDGVMTTDPRKVPNAKLISHMTYEEAMEMSHFGAKVLHPPTIQPAVDKNIPIYIKNSFNPSSPGTIISRSEENSIKSSVVTGISSIQNIALIRMQGSGMVGISGISERFFRALSSKDINVILIIQASSEHSICIAVSSKDAHYASKALQKEFSLEISAHHIDVITVESDLSIIAVVGEQMRKAHGVSGKLFYTLGSEGVNIIAIAQGSSELNISFVIDMEDEETALNAIHNTFFVEEKGPINVFIVGTGLVGSALLNQIKERSGNLGKNDQEIRVLAIANSKKMIFSDHGLKLNNWKKLLEKGDSMKLKDFIEKMKQSKGSTKVFIDCTASEEIAQIYDKVLESDISIVTPNKKANTSTYDYYHRLKELAQNNKTKFLFETNVGAALPVISTLSDLVRSNDEVLKIEGVLSGTLSYIFNKLSEGKSFSEAVHEAKKKGYTEPDPREDLNGMDVARKLLILARELGLKLELKDVKVESLLSKSCKSAKTVDEFLTKLTEMDADFEQRMNLASKSNKVLHYVAKVQDGKAEVAIHEVDQHHPCYSLEGSDNIVVFTTKRYKDRPLAIKGSGAGAEVTAGGVLTDILHIP